MYLVRDDNNNIYGVFHTEDTLLAAFPNHKVIREQEIPVALFTFVDDTWVNEALTVFGIEPDVRISISRQL